MLHCSLCAWETSINQRYFLEVDLAVGFLYIGGICAQRTTGPPCQETHTFRTPFSKMWPQLPPSSSLNAKPNGYLLRFLQNIWHILLVEPDRGLPAENASGNEATIMQASHYLELEFTHPRKGIDWLESCKNQSFELFGKHYWVKGISSLSQSCLGLELNSGKPWLYCPFFRW